MPPQKTRIKETFEEKPDLPGNWKSGTRWIPGLLVLMLTVFMAFFEQYFLPLHLPLVGKPCQQAIRAPYDFVFDEQRAIENTKERKLSQFTPIFILDPQKSRQVLTRWQEFFNGLKQCSQLASTSASKARACAREQFTHTPDEKALNELRRYPHLEKMESLLTTTLEEQLDTMILADQEIPENLTSLRIESHENRMEPINLSEVVRLSEARGILMERLELIDISPGLRSALGQELSSLVEPNLFYADKNEKLLASIRAQRSERKRVLYQRGDLLVRRGQIVSLLDFYRVQACLAKSRPDTLLMGAGSFLPFFLITLVFVLISQRMGWAYGRSPSQTYLLVFFVVLSVLLLAKVLYLFTNLSGFAIPMGAGGFIVALLLDLPAGLLAVMLTAVYTTFLTSFDMGLFVYYLVGGVFLVLAVGRSTRRIRLLFYSILVGGLNVLVLLCLLLIRDQIPSEPLLRELAPQAFLSAPGAWLLAILLMPLGEKLFRLATPDRLRELADLNHPLLRKLQEKAPGTYYHSLAVANLASVAAEAVRADVLLVRVGAYYHDVGKVMEPDYFIENQNNRENPHDTLEPAVSYKIVKSHVADGVAIAKEYRLPKAVIDLIAEHHGTTVIEAFYSKAKENKPEMQWDRDFFRYDGPKPASLEAGILMIADVVEAVGRVLKTTNPLEVKEKVHKIIVSKFEDRQFSQCRFPTSTLAQIESAMIQALLGILHKRIDYPEDKSREDRTQAA